MHGEYQEAIRAAVSEEQKRALSAPCFRTRTICHMLLDLVKIFFGEYPVAPRLLAEAPRPAVPLYSSR